MTAALRGAGRLLLEGALVMDSFCLLGHDIVKLQRPLWVTHMRQLRGSDNSAYQDSRISIHHLMKAKYAKNLVLQRHNRH
jgi:hypothetical protein